MLVLDKYFIENNQTPLIVANKNGEIKFKNSSASYFLKKNDLLHVTNIEEFGLDGNLERDLKNASVKKSVRIKKIIYEVVIRKTKYNEEEGCILLQINQNITNADFDDILDKIDDGITVVNKYKQLEIVNQENTRLMGLKAYVGEKLRDLVKKNILERSASLEVFKHKKPVHLNITYISRKTLMVSSRPLFDDNGEVSRVVTTSRDISELINLEKKLKHLEDQKNEYLNKLQELNDVYAINNVVYASSEMKKILDMCNKVASTDSSVFLNGETGVGKEVIARYIYKNSPLNDKPFISINCGAIPENLLESELFGYEEGSFTGAKKGGKKGLFEEAHDGIIFLDEISELPYQMQSKLLRVVQEKKFSRIGSNRSKGINARFISASNLEIGQLLDNKEFRQDLYYRLATIPIHVPPLRDRKSDILPLTEYFLKQYNKKYTRHVTIHRDLIDDMADYDWPGNIRELRNFVERIVIISDSEMIKPGELNMVPKFRHHSKKEFLFAGEPDGSMPLSKTIKKMENAIIMDAYNKHKNIYKVAEVLKISPSTIYRKIKRGEIDINK